MADNNLKIDDLKIDIVVDTRKAENALRKLSDTLRTLSAIRLRTDHIRNFVRELSDISKVGTGIHNLARDLTDLSKAVKGFQVIGNLANTMNSLIKNGSAEDALYGATNKSVGSANKSIVSIADSLRALNEVGKNTEGLQDIARQLKAIADEGSRLYGVSRYITSVKNAVERANKLKSPLPLAARMGTIMEGSASAEDMLGSEMESSIEVVTHAAEEAAGAVRSFGNAAEEAGEKARKTEKPTLQLSENLKRITTAVFGALQGLPALGKSLLTAFGKGISDSISRVTKKIKTLTSSIARIAFYRLIRSAIRGITSAIREGVNALIDWDREWGNNTSHAAETADTIAAKWGEVKKSFGAAAMPLIQLV